jgi:deoxyribodipyrimidine photolyase-related protein
LFRRLSFGFAFAPGERQMTAIRVVLGDQLSPGVSSLRGIDHSADIVLMAEVAAETDYVPHHKQKIAMVLSAMRHFAAELQGRGLRVKYVRLDDPLNSGSLAGEIARAAARFQADRVILCEPGEWRLLEDFRKLEGALPCPVEIRSDDRFLSDREEFARWAQGRKAIRMEHFYREMRLRTGILMDGGVPAGGQWNYDAENRKPLPRDAFVPKRLRFEPDRTTREVMELVERRFGNNFGSLSDFGWPVTHAEAFAALDDFISNHLSSFGDYQDAMRDGAPFLHHSLIAPALNLGLLDPRQTCERAEDAWKRGIAPLNAVEGFIRQILGWREFVRGVYWTNMPGYEYSNALGAHRPLPDFYWTGKTAMRCVSQVVKSTAQHAYSHHIQRLMVTGNFALLAGIDPREVERWYLAVYADAYEWVEMPNTLGMALYADGGLLASKPYAASGAYISRMSDFCGSCSFDVKAKSGDRACPFNRLYWDFLIRNRDILSANPRLAMPYRNIAAMPAHKQAAVRDDAQKCLEFIT